MATTTDVPDDIVLLILSFLPVKSLLRFRSVCRSWKAMVSDPRFLRMHLDQSKKRLSRNLFVRMSSENFPNEVGPHPFSEVRVVGDGGYQLGADLGSPADGRNFFWLDFKCACDGVMLVKDTDQRYMLWNPFTQKKTLFPKHPYKFYAPSSFGICYDPITMDDFKVVVVSWDYYAVHSCKSGSWSDKKIFPYSILNVVMVPGIFADGVIYWALRNKEGGFKEIVWFDRSNDDLKTLPRPKHVEAGGVEFELVCLRGCLCLFYETKGGDQIHIWVKENETKTPACCWKELMVVVKILPWMRPMKTPACWQFRPLCFLENNDIVFKFDCGTQYVVYSPCEKMFRRFGVAPKWEMAPCLQSLLFPSTIAS